MAREIAWDYKVIVLNACSAYNHACLKSYFDWFVNELNIFSFIVSFWLLLWGCQRLWSQFNFYGWIWWLMDLQRLHSVSTPLRWISWRCHLEIPKKVSSVDGSSSDTCVSEVSRMLRFLVHSWCLSSTLHTAVIGSWRGWKILHTPAPMVPEIFHRCPERKRIHYSPREHHLG